MAPNHENSSLCNIYIVNIWHYVAKSPPPPSLNFDPGDFKGTGHKFNLMFQTLQICR